MILLKNFLICRMQIDSEKHSKELEKMKTELESEKTRSVKLEQDLQRWKVCGNLNFTE